MKRKIPTGYLFTVEGSRGSLETLSIGDYGKSKNIKADFLGYSRELDGVQNGKCVPLQEKWVITVSTQYGCPQKCKFCSVPQVPFKGNASFSDLKKQFYEAIACFPDVKYTDRLNLHFARMGEPILNPEVFNFAEWVVRNKRTIQRDIGLRIETLHPVLTTSLPKRFKKLEEYLQQWVYIKNSIYNGQAGLQISINSTNEDQRNDMFSGESLTLDEFSKIASRFQSPIGRKYCLNIALASGYEVNAKKLSEMFNPDDWMVKITPIHNNKECRENGIATVDGYSSFEPYRQVEHDLKEAGFDVLVFIPSQDEEDSFVTCGNLVLSQV